MTDPSKDGASPCQEIDIRGIMQRIPHRYPFLMIDRIISCDEKMSRAIKNVTINEPFFQGHFPAEPIVPGMLLGECMAQAAAFVGAVIKMEDGVESLESIGARGILAGMNLKLNKPVGPGCQLIITANLVKRLGQLAKFTARIESNSIVVATSDFTIASEQNSHPKTAT